MALTVRITNLSIKNVKNIMIETNFVIRENQKLCNNPILQRYTIKYKTFILLIKYKKFNFNYKFKNFSKNIYKIELILEKLKANIKSF